MGFKKRGGRESLGTRVIHAEFVGSLAGFGLDNSWDTGEKYPIRDKVSAECLKPKSQSYCSFYSKNKLETYSNFLSFHFSSQRESKYDSTFSISKASTDVHHSDFNNIHIFITISLQILISNMCYTLTRFNLSSSLNFLF